MGPGPYDDGAVSAGRSTTTRPLQDEPSDYGSKAASTEVIGHRRSQTCFLWPTHYGHLRAIAQKSETVAGSELRRAETRFVGANSGLIKWAGQR